jgi:hypothetical protein
MSARTTVLYITGAGRSCTTLLGHILGQIEGFAFVGEAVHAWRALDERLCGCGVPLARCEFWLAVRREAGGGHMLEASAFFGLGRLARWRHLPSTYLPGRERRLPSRYGDSWAGAERLYRATAAVSGAGIIVDSSKAVPYGRLLGLLPGLDVRVVHLVRDARGVTNSWLRWKPAPDRIKPYVDRRTPLRSVINWTISTLGGELVFRPQGPYLRLRYEDLAARPLEAVERIVRLATAPPGGGGEPPPPVELPFIGERAVRLAPTHSIKGNPDRLQTGVVEIRLDDRWKRELAPRNRRLVTALTWPLLARDGYLGR